MQSFFLSLLLATGAETLAAPSPAHSAASLGASLADLDSEIASVEARRGLDPNDPATLELLSSLHGKNGDKDSELAYLMLAFAAWDELEFDDPKEKEEKLTDVGARLTKLDPGAVALKASRDQLTKDLVWAVDLYAKNKKVHNALDVAGSILAYKPGNKFARDTVNAILSKLDDDGRAQAERLLGRSELRRPRAFLQDWRKKHVQWKDAARVTSRGYVVTSNIGYDVLHLATRALEDLALHYRRAYAADPSMQIGKTDVQLFRSQADFEKAFPTAKENPGIKGVLMTEGGGEDKKPKFSFKLFSFDPRDEGRPLSFLFETLAHEASHQYMRLSVGMNPTPHWLDEGMASFYEGAVLDADGSVHVGLPAWERLRVLIMLLDQDPNVLRATIEAPDDKFLSAEQYSIAWGLVYYLDQHRLEDGTHPYRASLKRAIEVVRSGTATSGLTIFQRAVLQPANRSFEVFEKEWIEAMRALNGIESDPERALEHYLERAEASAKRGLADAAREDFQRVLVYSREHPAALVGLATLAQTVSDKSKKLEDKDVTLAWARRAHRSASNAGDEELVKAALVIARKADPGGFDKMAEGERRYRRSVEQEITKHLGAARPKTALALTRRWLDDVLEDDRSTKLMRELREAGTVALERPYLPFDGNTLDGLSCEPGFFTVEAGEVVCGIQRTPDGGTDIASLFVESELAPRFRLEGELRVDSPDGVVIFGVELPWLHTVKGLALRVRPGGGAKPLGRDYPPFHELGSGEIAPIDQVTDASGFQTWQFRGSRRSEVGFTHGTWMRFALVRDPNDTLRLLLDGEEVSVRELEDKEAALRAGLVFYGGSARVRNLRVVELDRL